MPEVPVRRGPGRPRRAESESPSVEARPSDPADGRIGTDVHPDATAVGFDDGSQYRVEDGVLVERVG